MLKDFQDLRTMDFAPLSDVKAKLSEYLRRLGKGGRRIALTTNGRPTAVLMAYEDYLKWLDDAAGGAANAPVQRISLAEWQKEKKNQESVRDSILGLFRPEELSRKGQKQYKQKLVEGQGDARPSKKTR